jgi:8-oxo-dGTP pyrophosphatase MutT (NUDIX family)
MIEKIHWYFSAVAPITRLMKTRDQVGALCVSGGDDGKPRIMLVTSRETSRWVIPKGWPIKRRKDHKAAAREAFEEAGVSGEIETKPIGGYQYVKFENGSDQLLSVSVFLLAVDKQKNSWPEQEQRQRAWFSIEEAARRVDEHELRALIRSIAKLDNHPKWLTLAPAAPVKRVQRTERQASR